MGKRGAGYGSEDHLLRYLAEQPQRVNAAVAARIGVEPSELVWLERPRRPDGGTREFQGLEFLARDPDAAPVLETWREFWPRTGRQPSWDAVGRARGGWLLVEAKANHPEFCTPPSTARDEGSRRLIGRALGRVKRDLGVHRYFPWTGTYYQYANRLAVLWFLRKHGIDARLVFVYFVGDVFPDGTECPRTEQEWEALIEARRLTLGLPPEHALSPFEHHVVLEALHGREAARDG